MRTSHGDSPIVLDDLDSPRFSDGALELIVTIESIADLCPLESAALHAQASTETGLSDFGAQDYLPRLDLLLQCYRDTPGLTRAGAVNLYMQLLQMLKNRLLLVDLLRREPEVADVELRPPVVIAGLPRTGTTHLHQLLAATDLFRTLPYWESNEPFPLATEVGMTPDPRWTRCEQAMAMMHQLLPHLISMHEMDTPDHVHEEIGLLANDFSSMHFETLTDIPAWRDYYLAHDQEPHYAYLRLQLQALQHLRGGRRWLLKSPQHLEQLPALTAVFPEATVIFSHRDPVHVATSMTTMLTYINRMYVRRPDPHHIARVWTERLVGLLQALLRDRNTIGPERSLDVIFEEFMSDQAGTLQHVLDLAGESFTPHARAGTDRYLAGHHRGHFGSIDYRPEAVGLVPDELADLFSVYVDRFL